MGCLKHYTTVHLSESLFFILFISFNHWQWNGKNTHAYASVIFYINYHPYNKYGKIIQ